MPSVIDIRGCVEERDKVKIRDRLPIILVEAPVFRSQDLSWIPTKVDPEDGMQEMKKHTAAIIYHNLSKCNSIAHELKNRAH